MKVTKDRNNFQKSPKMKSPQDSSAKFTPCECPCLHLSSPPPGPQLIFISLISLELLSDEVDAGRESVMSIIKRKMRNKSGQSLVSQGSSVVDSGPNLLKVKFLQMCMIWNGRLTPPPPLFTVIANFWLFNFSSLIFCLKFLMQNNWAQILLLKIFAAQII